MQVGRKKNLGKEFARAIITNMKVYQMCCQRAHGFYRNIDAAIHSNLIFAHLTALLEKDLAKTYRLGTMAFLFYIHATGVCMGLLCH